MNQPKYEEPKFTIQDILNEYFTDYLKSPSRNLYIDDHILKAINQIKVCRTERMGVYLIGCKCCGVCKPIPRSCKNRFCSKCGSSDTQNWIKDLSLKLPDIKHYHVVFTLPKKLRVFCKRNAHAFYGIMFKSSQFALKEVFAKKSDLQPGIISVLHTNGSDLKYHPHIHTILSAGGFNGNKELEELSSDFLVPQRVLANKFREIFIKEMMIFLKSESANLSARFKCPNELNRYLKSVREGQWIVNIESPLKGVEKIVAYVGRYTRKSCISERRILNVADGQVTMSYKDYKNSERGEKPKEGQMTMSVVEFLDRLLQHVPLKGLKVVRYYGMYSSSNWKHIPEDKKVKQLNISDEEIRKGMMTLETETMLDNYRIQLYRDSGIDPMYCYECMQEMELIEIYMRNDKDELIRIAYEKEGEPINSG